MPNIPPGTVIPGVYSTVGTPTQRGLSVPFCRRQTGKWSPTTGWTLDQDFNGLSLANMEAIAAQCQAAGIEYEITAQNGLATMRTTDTTGNITIDVWEVVASREAASVFGNPVVFANVSSNDLTVLTYSAITGETPDADGAVATLNKTVPPPSPVYTPPDVQTPSATQRLYVNAILAGEATYLLDRYTLRHTTNASNRGYFNVADFGVNDIYTQSQLYSEIQNPSYWIFPAPPEIIGSLNSVFAGLGPAPSTGITGKTANYVVGALKGGSTRSTAARDRVNITTEYNIAIIDADRYFPE